MLVHRWDYAPQQQPLEEMSRVLAALERAFNKLVDMLMAKEVKALIAELQKATTATTFRGNLHKAYVMRRNS